MIDLSKAFYTLDHGILISKLKYYGLSDLSLNLIRNYLSNRKQYVYWDRTMSSYKGVSIGVPQGSILGPLLYIIYMADLNNSSKLFRYIFYADDTTLYLNCDNNALNEEIINAELVKVVRWFNINKLTINPRKTKMMTFSYRKPVGNLNLLLDNVPILSVDEFNFLGLTVDKHLSWRAHINKIALKLSRTNFVLNKLKNFLRTVILRIMYFSLIQSHLNFGILLWGHTIKNDPNNQDILTKLQKRLLRIITKSTSL